jgi:thioredoxin 1
MKKYVFVLMFLAACSKNKEEIVLSPAEFQAKYKETANAILLDVRTPGEIAIDRIENSRSIVFNDSFADNIGNLEHQPLFVYCASGKRSAKAAAILRNKGYEKVYELEGGLGAWKEAALPVDSSPR